MLSQLTSLMLRKQRSELKAALLNASITAHQRAVRVIFTFHVPQHMKQPPPQWLAVPPSVHNCSSVVGIAYSVVRASHLVPPTFQRMSDSVSMTTQAPTQ